MLNKCYFNQTKKQFFVTADVTTDVTSNNSCMAIKQI